MAGFAPTGEQLDVVEAFKIHRQLKIDAKAGAGKTSTLKLLAEDNPVPSLYLTFNKNMAEEARSKFPKHVDVRTTHSIAYSVIGKDIAHKLTRPTGEYKNVCGTGSEIARKYNIAPLIITKEKSISGIALGYAVKSTLTKFEHSADRELKEKHVSFYEAEKVFHNPQFNKKEYAKRVLKYAEKLWKERINPDSDIVATHDTYLKLFQLSNPDLVEFDIIYLDEAHDSNACILDIIFRQKCKVVIVGDVYQAIYAWRGAVNAMENTNWETRYLTTSFRFGEDVADVAKTILLDEDGNRHVDIKGYEKLNTRVVSDTKLTKFTWLFRTNAALINEAIEMIAEGKKINISVDIGDFKSLLLSALALKAGKKKGVKHYEFVSFDSWEEFEEDIEISNRPELKRIYKYVQSGRAARILEVLGDYKPSPNPDVNLTTAHSAKGLEYDVVVLADDFPEFELSGDGSWIGWPDQERNLLYVAATRAKKLLVTNKLISDLYSWLNSNEEGMVQKKFGGIEVDMCWIDEAQSLVGHNLDHKTQCQMAGQFGVIMTDLDKFIEGGEGVANEMDENGDLLNPDHWMNMRPY